MPWRRARSAPPTLTPAQELLLRATLLDGDAALSAWREWRAANTLETIDYGSFHLLPRLSANLVRLGHDDPLMPKLHGLTRHAFLRRTTTLRAARQVVATLDEARVPTLLLGGAATTLLLPDDPGISLTHVDLRVDPVDLANALAALERAGWQIGDRASLVQLAPFTPAITVHHAEWPRATLRLQLHPLAVGCPPAAERALRSRAMFRDLQGRSVLVPDPTDLLILVCLAGRGPDPAVACSWFADVLALSGTAIAWPEVLPRSRQAGLGPVIAAALRAAHRRLPPAIPAAVVADAEADAEVAADGHRRIDGLLHDPRPGRSLADQLVTHWRRHLAAGQSGSAIGLARHLHLLGRRAWWARGAWMPLRRPATAASLRRARSLEE